jgi:uncharacterized protein YdcH (DUF465 family)
MNRCLITRLFASYSKINDRIWNLADGEDPSGACRFEKMKHDKGIGLTDSDCLKSANRKQTQSGFCGWSSFQKNKMSLQAHSRI